MERLPAGADPDRVGADQPAGAGLAPLHQHHLHLCAAQRLDVEPGGAHGGRGVADGAGFTKVEPTVFLT